LIAYIEEFELAKLLEDPDWEPSKLTWPAWLGARDFGVLLNEMPARLAKQEAAEDPLRFCNACDDWIASANQIEVPAKFQAAMRKVMSDRAGELLKSAFTIDKTGVHDKTGKSPPLRVAIRLVCMINPSDLEDDMLLNIATACLDRFENLEAPYQVDGHATREDVQAFDELMALTQFHMALVQFQKHLEKRGFDSPGIHLMSSKLRLMIYAAALVWPAHKEPLSDQDKYKRIAGIDPKKPLQFDYDTFKGYQDGVQRHVSLKAVLRSDEGLKLLADVLGAAEYKDGEFQKVHWSQLGGKKEFLKRVNNLNAAGDAVNVVMEAMGMPILGAIAGPVVDRIGGFFRKEQEVVKEEKLPNE
jgi:hypothetical protein